MTGMLDSSYVSIFLEELPSEISSLFQSKEVLFWFPPNSLVLDMQPFKSHYPNKKCYFVS